MKEKDELVAQLSKCPVSSPHLRVDDRLLEYVIECISNPSGHNYYELLSIKRFIDFIYRDDIEFRSGEVRKFITFYESLKFSGKRGPTRYKLTPVQVFQFANIFGFYDIATGLRLIREVLLFVPRKFSKTTSIAAIAIYDILFGDTNAEAYVAANSYDQAQVCFRAIKQIVKNLDPRMKSFKTNREIIFNLRKGRTSFARCLASDPDNLDGLNASTVIVDEYSQADTADLKNVLTSSMGNRDNPLTCVITTASQKMDTPFQTMLTVYKEILKGNATNDHVFAHIFEPDEDDEFGDPATWEKVQPHLGVTVNHQFYKSEWVKAQLAQDDMIEFKCKLLNVFAAKSNKEWIPADKIKAITRPVRLNTLQQRYWCMVAVDLSVRDDFSCVSYNVYDQVNRCFYVYNDYYMPEGALNSHCNASYYKEMHQKGYLKLVPGEILDYDYIVNDIVENSQYVAIMRIGYDPYKSIDFVNKMRSVGGADMVPFKQTYGAFTSPLETLEIAIFSEKIVIDDNPLNLYCFNNAVIDEDKLENRKPIKKTAAKKIDAVITTIMTLGLYNTWERTS